MINTISITDLKQNTSKAIKKVTKEEKSLVILQHSKVAAILVDPRYYEALEAALEDKLDLQAIEQRKNDSTISLEKYLSRRFGQKLSDEA